MKILITGALGYIGSALLSPLAHRFPKAELILLDNLSTGRLSALKELPFPKRFQFIQDDICRADLKGFHLSSSDYVIHLAGLSRAAESFTQQALYKKVNTAAALRIARFCASSGAAFFFPSTTSLYSGFGGETVKNIQPFLNPQTPYAESKWAAERALRKIPGLRFTFVRFGTIFGLSPVMTTHTAVNKFCRQAAVGEPIQVWETAQNQLRPYLDLRDAVSLILFLIQKNEFSGRIFDAATEHATAGDIIKIIQAHIPEAKLALVKSKAMNQLSYKVSRQDLKNLGFHFHGSLKRSIRTMLNRFGLKSFVFAD